MPEISAQNALELTERLIAIPSVSGQEREVVDYLYKLFKAYGWSPELFEVQKDRNNIFVAFGTPKIIFTTHTDVVPADPSFFKPRYENDKLFGRGACDAKGIIATMVEVAKELLKQRENNFGLLFVVGEETDGAGAQRAATDLKEHGIQYIVNGEPTDCKIYTAHKGAVGFRIAFKGRASHSGYPELGIDANAVMIETAAKLLAADFGFDEELGKATINLGKISGGDAINVISPSAELNGMIRTVSDTETVVAKLKDLVPASAELSFYNNFEPVRLLKVPGFETGIAAYGTDVPNFSQLNVPCVLFGPSSIHSAHTDQESISRREINAAINGYLGIYRYLRSL